jgi:hypothetical protein
MKIFIINTESICYCVEEKYKSKLENFHYEEVIDERGIKKTYIEINSLEDLEKLGNAVNKELIIDFRKSEENYYDEPFIEIYDDWRD